VAWWPGGLVAWWPGGLVAWWPGGLVAWWPGGLVAWWPGGRRSSGSMVQAAKQYNGGHAAHGRPSRRLQHIAGGTALVEQRLRHIAGERVPFAARCPLRHGALCGTVPFAARCPLRRQRGWQAGAGGTGEPSRHGGLRGTVAFAARCPLRHGALCGTSGPEVRARKSGPGPQSPVVRKPLRRGAPRRRGRPSRSGLR
jgi:hypothetical protein